MYLEAKDTVRLYQLLSEKLGNDTTEAMFKYIDNKTERSVEATIKSLAKDDLSSQIEEVRKGAAEIKLTLLNGCLFSGSDRLELCWPSPHFY